MSIDELDHILKRKWTLYYWLYITSIPYICLFRALLWALLFHDEVHSLLAYLLIDNTYYRMDSIDSESSYSSNGLNDDYYIKKHINAVPRGESAIFGEKHEESNQDLFPPSP